MSSCRQPQPTPEFVGLASVDSEAIGSFVRGKTVSSVLALPPINRMLSLPFNAFNSIGTPSAIISLGGVNGSYRTTDGINWSSMSYFGTADWRYGAYGNGTTIAMLGNATTTAISTDDGASWSAGGTLPGAMSVYGYYPPQAYSEDLGVFITSYFTGPYAIGTAISTDAGVSWTAKTSLAAEAIVVCTCWGGFASFAGGITNHQYTTDLGTTWNTFTTPSAPMDAFFARGMLHYLDTGGWVRRLRSFNDSWELLGNLGANGARIAFLHDAYWATDYGGDLSLFYSYDAVSFVSCPTEGYNYGGQVVGTDDFILTVPRNTLYYNLIGPAESHVITT